jgi:hypothetical protein
MAFAEGHIHSVVDQRRMMGYQITSSNTLQRLKLLHQQQQKIPFEHPMWMTVQAKIDAVDLEVQQETSNVNKYNTKEPAKRKGEHLIDAYYENSRNRTFRPISNTQHINAPVKAVVHTPSSHLSPLVPVQLVQRTDVMDAEEPRTTSAASANSSSSISFAEV